MQPAAIPVIALLFSLAHATAQAGPFAPAAGQPGSTAIARTDPAIVGWASAHRDYLPGANVDPVWQVPARALGTAVGDSFDVVSLGEGGRITISFDGLLHDGPGADFAVFENAFNDTFLELAYVEVSSDGTNFFRFPHFSFTPAPVGPFGAIDPTNVSGYAGKYRQGFGTPFDLAIFAGLPGLDIQAVAFVRLIDVVGNGSQFDDYPAAFGGPHPIYDPTPTVGSAGFDLEAVAALHLRALPPSPPPSPPAPVPVPMPAMLPALGALLCTLVAHRSSRR